MQGVGEASFAFLKGHCVGWVEWNSPKLECWQAIRVDKDNFQSQSREEDVNSDEVEDSSRVTQNVLKERNPKWHFTGCVYESLVVAPFTYLPNTSELPLRCSKEIPRFSTIFIQQIFLVVTTAFLPFCY